MSRGKLALVDPRFKATVSAGGRLTIKGPSRVIGACDLGGVLTDGTLTIPKGKRLVIEDDSEDA
jgi:hypothetical protein